MEWAAINWFRIHGKTLGQFVSKEQEVPEALFWMGRPVEEMTREELIKALRYMAEEQQRSFAAAREHADFTRQMCRAISEQRP